jgi:opacity protein-like surface antigen
LGYRWDCGLRLEGEVGYKYNEISKVKLAGNRVDVKGDVYTWSTMANVLYNLPVDFCLQPYVGAGIGYAKSHSHEKQDGVSVKESVDGFAHQLIAGVEYPLTHCLSLDTKYRYQKIQHQNYNQSVEMGLVYAF